MSKLAEINGFFLWLYVFIQKVKILNDFAERDESTDNCNDVDTKTVEVADEYNDNDYDYDYEYAYSDGKEDVDPCDHERTYYDVEGESECTHDDFELLSVLEEEKPCCTQHGYLFYDTCEVHEGEVASKCP